MAGSEYEELITLVGFVAGVYFGGWAFRQLRLPPMLGQIVVGVALGPEVADLLKESQYEFFRLLGEIGVTIMIFESGMHVSFEKLKAVACRALCGAILGTTLPLAAGALFVYVVWGGSQTPGLPLSSDPSNATATATTTATTGVRPVAGGGGGGGGASNTSVAVACAGDGSSSDCPDDIYQSVYPDGFSMGCAMAPTSVGIAIQLLVEAGQLESLFGQLILASSFIDDVFSIVALVILLKLADGDITAQDIVVPVVCSGLFLVLGSLTAFKLFPPLMDWISRRFPPTIEEFTPFQAAHQIQLVTMFGVLCLYTYITSIDVLIGSHLVGAFVAGMSFSTAPASHIVWGRQTKRINRWLARFFFAATIGFGIPLSEMLQWRSFYLGVIAGVLCGVATKLAAGVCAAQHKLLVGAGSAGRGEFAFLVATAARNTLHRSGEPPYGRMMSAEVYSVTVWALLTATIATPFLFNYLLARLPDAEVEGDELDENIGDDGAAAADEDSTAPVHFQLGLDEIRGSSVPFFAHDLLSDLKDLGLIVNSKTMETDGCVFVMTTTKTRDDDVPGGGGNAPPHGDSPTTFEDALANGSGGHSGNGKSRGSGSGRHGPMFHTMKHIIQLCFKGKELQLSAGSFREEIEGDVEAGEADVQCALQHIKENIVRGLNEAVSDLCAPPPVFAQGGHVATPLAQRGSFESAEPPSFGAMYDAHSHEPCAGTAPFP